MENMVNGKLIIRDNAQLLQAEAQAAQRYIESSRSEATRRAYASDWNIFTVWAAERGLTTLPASPDTVCLFLAAQAESGVKAATLSRRMASIRLAHTSEGLEPPTSSEAVRTTMKGIRREIGVAPVQKAPATSDRLLDMISHCRPSLLGIRDRAILLLGFGAALRRSELAALMVDDIEEVDGGLRVTIRKSKTDQEAAGEVVPVARGMKACPAVAIASWMEAAGITDGPLFRMMRRGGKVTDSPLSPHSVGAVVKKYAALAGFKASDFGGHSLRSGFATSAAMNGASIFRIMDVTRHRSVDTVRGYVRRAEEFEDHAGNGLL